MAEFQAREYHPAFEEYCEAIYELHEDDVAVIQARIAERLGVSRPAVSEMIRRLEQKAVMKPQPEVHIRGDKDARFQDIGRLVYDCQRSGIQKVGFLTEPQNNVAQ